MQEIPRNVEADTIRSCDSCQSTRQTTVNPFYRCRKCSNTIHMLCYGSDLLKQPDRTAWKCSQCKRKKCVPQIYCFICLKSEGILKCFYGRIWAHPFCIQWTPGFTFIDSQLDTFDYETPEAKLEDLCVICKKTDGIPMRCAEEGCKNWFHVRCALHKELIPPQLFKMKAPGALPVYCWDHRKGNEVDVISHFLAKPRPPKLPDVIILSDSDTGDHCKPTHDVQVEVQIDEVTKIQEEKENRNPPPPVAQLTEKRSGSQPLEGASSLLRKKRPYPCQVIDEAFKQFYGELKTSMKVLEAMPLLASPDKPGEGMQIEDAKDMEKEIVMNFEAEQQEKEKPKERAEQDLQEEQKQMREKQREEEAEQRRRRKEEKEARKAEEERLRKEESQKRKEEKKQRKIEAAEAEKRRRQEEKAEIRAQKQAKIEEEKARKAREQEEKKTAAAEGLSVERPRKQPDEEKMSSASPMTKKAPKVKKTYKKKKKATTTAAVESMQPAEIVYENNRILFQMKNCEFMDTQREFRVTSLHDFLQKMASHNHTRSLR